MNPGADVDVTVMAYAQWLSEMKQQASNSRYQQQAELDLMRDAINANNGELVDFKRHSSQVVQQLQVQVTELRAKLSESFAELAQQSRQKVETDQRTENSISELHKQVQALSGRHQTTHADHASLIEKFTAEVGTKLTGLDREVADQKRALASNQEQTVMKFGEVDKAMSIFLSNINGSRQELADTKEDWKKSQNLLGQAIQTLSQDLANFQKHASTVMNKLQSDSYQLEELGRQSKERSTKIEAQLVGLQQNVYTTTNDLILLKDEKAPSAARTPPAKRLSPRPEADSTASAIQIERNSSAATPFDYPSSSGATGFQGGQGLASAPSRGQLPTGASPQPSWTPFAEGMTTDAAAYMPPGWKPSPSLNPGSLGGAALSSGARQSSAPNAGSPGLGGAFNQGMRANSSASNFGRSPTPVGGANMSR